MRNVVSAFGRVARRFVSPEDIHATRLNLKHSALRLKHDAAHARSWGFWTIGSLAHKLLDRRQDPSDRRESNLRSYAERAVWLTHFLDGPEGIKAVKEDILDGNVDGITVDELDVYLGDNLDTLPLHGATNHQRATMLANIRKQPLFAAEIPHLSP